MNTRRRAPPGADTARGLHSLADLKRALAQARQEAERHEALQREIAAREKRERELFATSVGAVQPLRPSDRVRHELAPPSPEPRQRQRDERAALRESLSDEFNVDTLLET